MPFRDVHRDRLVFSDEPAHPLGIDDNTLAVLDNDAAGPFLVDHGIVWGGGMNIALIATDRPSAILRKFPAPVLDPGIVPRLPHLHPEFEVLHRAPPPNQKLVVSELLRTGRLAGDAPLLDGPQFRIAIPSGEILAVEQSLEPFLIRRPQWEHHSQKTETNQRSQHHFHGVGEIGQFLRRFYAKRKRCRNHNVPAESVTDPASPVPIPQGEKQGAPSENSTLTEISAAVQTRQLRNGAKSKIPEHRSPAQGGLLPPSGTGETRPVNSPSRANRTSLPVHDQDQERSFACSQ